MNETLLIFGVVCVIVAIVGGGVTFFKVAQFPLIGSTRRQSMLAIVGVALAGGSFVIPSAATEDKSDGSSSRKPTGAPAITLSKASGPPGLSLRVGGSGFAPGETIRIRFHVQEVAVTEAGADGSFGGQTVVVPRDTPFDGSFSITATGEGSGRSASREFEIAAPSIKLSPTSGPPGTKVTVTGSGFGVGETVEIELHLESLAEVQVDSEGRFSEAITIPSSWSFAGQFDVKATGETSHRTARKAFTVT